MVRPEKNRRMESVDLTAVSDWAQTSKQILKQAAFVWSTRGRGLFVKSRPHFVIVDFYSFVMYEFHLYLNFICLTWWWQCNICDGFVFCHFFAFCVCMNLYVPILVFAFVWQGGAVQHIHKSAGLTHFVIIDRPCPSFVKVVVFRVKL